MEKTYNTDRWEEVEAFGSDELDDNGGVKYLSLTNKDSYYFKTRSIRNKQ